MFCNILIIICEDEREINKSISEKGTPRLVTDYAFDEAVLLFSEETLQEVHDVFMRSKFDRYVNRKDRKRAYEYLYRKSSLVVPGRRFFLSPDEKDNKFLDVAVEGSADFIISGDRRDMLSLGKVENIRIVSAGEFLNIQRFLR